MPRIFVFVACLFLNACMMVGPDFKDPKLPVANGWLKKTNSTVKNAPFRDFIWWEKFHDPTLTALINQGYYNNLSLQIAGLRVLQARATLAQSVGQLYPQTQAMIGNYTHQRIGGSSFQSILPQSFDTAALGFTANWELDFWGKYRRAIQSNDAAFLASIAAYDNALVTLLADIASAYINIRTNEELINVTLTNIKLQKESFRIAKSRFDAGQTSLLDVQQSQTELSETESTLPGLINQLQHQKDILAVLLGITPDEVDKYLVPKHGIPKPPKTIAVGIPRETLDQRPDIHQARLEAMAQSAAIGATKANLFPSLSLAGTFEFSSSNIGKSSVSDLFNWSNRMTSAGPSLTWPLFNYGQITNAVRIQDAIFQQSLLQYMNTVLQAQQEVQDNITHFIQSQKAERSLIIANNSALKSTKLALIRYKEGETDYTTVLDVERQQLRVQTSLTNTKGEISLALVALYRSLGGGWQIRNGNDIVSPEIKTEMAERTNWGSLLEQNNHFPPTSMLQALKQHYLPTW